MRRILAAAIAGAILLPAAGQCQGTKALYPAAIAAALGYTPMSGANNLSDLVSASTARVNLGLGTAAVLSSGAVLQSANNLSDLASASTALTNLGLGTVATQSAGAVAITGGTVDGTAIGGTTKSTGAFTTATVGALATSSSSVGVSSCGSGSPSVLGNIIKGKISTGSSAITACTLTGTWSTAPVCTINAWSGSTPVVAAQTSSGTTSQIFTFGSITSGSINYHCIQ